MRLREPVPSWSTSRQRKLDPCPRAFCYSYHLAWNGRLDDAPAEPRMASRLNKLTTLDALLGQQIDERARELEPGYPMQRIPSPLPSVHLERPS